MRWSILAVLFVGVACEKPGGICAGGSPFPDGGPPPEALCTPELIGTTVCPAGKSGWGYSCTDRLCWSFFLDGPCSSPFGCQTPCLASEEGVSECRGDQARGCVGGCWGSTASIKCDASPDGGQCQTKAATACTAIREGEVACEADAGLRCLSDCWQSLSDAGC